MGVRGLYSKGVPPQPPFLLWIKVAILVLSVIVLALAAYSISLSGGYGGYYGYGYSGAGGLLIFVVIKTWIVYGLLLFFELKAPQYYYRLIGIIGYSFGVIFWLSGFAWAASIASLWLSLSQTCYGGICYGAANSATKAFGGAMGGCAGIGALIWILSIVNLVFFVRGCLADEGAVTHNNAELGHVPKQAEAQPQVYQQQPAPQQQPPYGQQPVYGQQQPAYGQQQPAYGQQQQPYPTQ